MLSVACTRIFLRISQKDTCTGPKIVLSKNCIKKIKDEKYFERTVENTEQEILQTVEETEKRKLYDEMSDITF